VFCGLDSSAGIATGYLMEGPGIESRWGRYFPHPSRLTWSTPSHLYSGHWYTLGAGCLTVVKRRGRGVEYRPHLAPRLKKEFSYTCTPSLRLRVLFCGEILYVFCSSDYVYVEVGFFHVHTQVAAVCLKS